MPSFNHFSRAGILSFNDPWHDSSFFFTGAQGAVHVESERYSRRKYDFVNPMLAFAALFGDRVGQFTDIAMVINGEVANYMRQLVRAKHRGEPAAQVLRDMPFGDHRRVADLGLPTFPNDTAAVADLVRHLMRPDVRIHFVGHHASHVANAFYSSPFDSAMAISLDGGGLDFAPLPSGANVVGEAAITAASGAPLRRQIYGSVYACDNNRIRLVDQHRDFSLGSLWNRVVTEVLGMKDGEEGTAMAMAALGDPARFRAQMDAGVAIYPQMVLLDAARGGELTGWIDHLRRQVVTQQDVYDVAAALQASTEVRVRHLLETVVGREQRRLCLTGGVFLNCQITGKIGEWLPWIEDVYIPPAPYDGGLSIGGAQLIWHEVMDQTDRIGGAGIAPYAMGQSYDAAEVRSAISESGLEATHASAVEMLTLVAEGRVGGLFQGGAESGRRALGNRSIIAHPGTPGLKQRLNDAVKHRQWYRPFAPMVLAERVSDWFECPPGFQSPYMSFAVPVRPERREAIANVTHLDGSARLQTVHHELSPRFHGLLTAWEQMTGLPVLLNTSFNDREPIVQTPADALRTFMRTPIDFLYFADHELLVRRGG